MATRFQIRGRTMAVVLVLSSIQPSLTVGLSSVFAAPRLPVLDQWSYADTADLFVDAPIVLRAKIASAVPIKDASVPPGTTRFYIEADVLSLIRAGQPMPPKLAWLVDVLPDSRGKIAKLKNAQVVIAARSVADRPSIVQLVARDAQRRWTPLLETQVRALVTAATAPNATPAISGIASAFHTAGTVAGESETQIFLTTATQVPMSLTVLTRPGQPRRWAFAQGEIVDEAAAPLVRDTLPWYRLACFFPRDLPASATAELAEQDALAARADYTFVIEALGACPRTRR